ncbi:glutamate 5-kinase [Dissulfurirhabdus thermomarina]|uniref:Glutamate 5-kinase n=1 Tax=Dissulfurirhabdus thermomarina TaxID=1765737 RepID=A0A6N9TXP2_DISTH|nr:glutamate 5-kinase [Dissulfurirhabdus thermomarina]NDY43246.1 glutamate 5-kinase [Dissulfurirhabdus thermomarina]NMX22588.1 glutamate 5-kinase [Dissulfurirhabdus thermomarina]
METGGVNRKAAAGRARNVVVKVGSAVLTAADGLDLQVLGDLCRQVAALRASGRRLTLVSSGAIAAGRRKMAHLPPPRTVPEKQALAAVGQGRLIRAYEEAFDRFDIRVAQILLTRDGLVARRRYLNARNTLQTLLQWGVVPVINENDTVATEEIQFTDNDALAALIVHLVEADFLVCLSDIDGLYDRDPADDPGAARIPEVAKIDDGVAALASPRPGRAGRGGMHSKIAAARMVTASGVPVVVAGGRTPDVLGRIFAGEDVGTFFHPRPGRALAGRKPWIAMALAREGAVRIDAGAARALTEMGRSLLPAGVRAVEGEFEAGACVVCLGPGGEEVAVGLTNYGSGELRKILGCQTGEICEKIGYPGAPEVIHRDNMVLL